MDTIKFTAFLFYRYYSRGKNYGISYVNTILALSMLFFLNLFAVLILLNIPNIIPSFDKLHRLKSFFKMAFFLLPIALLFILIIKKSILDKANYNELKIRRGNIYLICYIILSIALLSLLIWYKRG